MRRWGYDSGQVVLGAFSVNGVHSTRMPVGKWSGIWGLTVIVFS